MEWTVDRDGDEFLYTFIEAGVGIGFQHLEEMRDGLHADMFVQSTIPTMTGHIHWCRMNLSSSSTRERLAQTLRKSIKEVEWPKLLEIACTKTAIDYRQGDPLYDLATQPIPTAPAYLISKLLPEQVTTILFGDGGTAKSILSMAIAVAVQTGNIILPNNLIVNHQTNVLYLDWETSLDDQIERLHAVARGLGVTPPSVRYRRMYRPIADESARIRDEVKKNKIGLVIVDSLGFASGGNLKDNDVALGAMNGIGKLGATCLAIAHITKEDAKADQGKATPFGSGFFSFSARSTWEIRGNSEIAANELQIGLFHRKANRGPVQKIPLGFTVRFCDEPVSDRLTKVEIEKFSVADDPQLAQHASLPYRLRELLKRYNGTPQTTETLAKKLDAKEKSITRALSRMVDIVNLAGRGRGNEGLWAFKAYQEN